MPRSDMRLPGLEDSVGPVTILDGEGRVVRIVPALEFRRSHVVSAQPTTESWRRRKERAKTASVVTSHHDGAAPEAFVTNEAEAEIAWHATEG